MRRLVRNRRISPAMYFISAGGRAHYDDQGTPLPNGEVFNGTTYGVLKLALGPGTYAWQIAPVAGGTLADSGMGH